MTLLKLSATSVCVFFFYHNVSSFAHNSISSVIFSAVIYWLPIMGTQVQITQTLERESKILFSLSFTKTSVLFSQRSHPLQLLIQVFNHNLPLNFIPVVMYAFYSSGFLPVPQTLHVLNGCYHIHLTLSFKLHLSANIIFQSLRL